MKNYFLIFIGILLTSCEPFDSDKFNYTNQSEKDILFYEANIMTDFVYPDTMITQNQNLLTKIKANITLRTGGFGSSEETFTKLLSDTLSVYFFEPDVMENSSFEDIRSNYRILKRYDLS